MRTEFEYQLTEADCAAAMRFNNRHLLRQARNIRQEMLVAALAVAIWVGFVIAVHKKLPDTPTFFLIGVLLLLLLVIVQAHLRARRVASYIVKHSAVMKGVRRLQVEDDGLRVTGPDRETLVRWHTFQAVHELDGQLLIYTDPISFLQISRAAFSVPEEQAEFVELLKSRAPGLTHAKAEDARTVVVPVSAPEDRLLATSWRIFVRNVEAGVKLAFFMRVDAGSLHFSWGHLLALITLNLGLAFACEVFYGGIDGHVYLDALPGYLFVVPTILGAWLLACIGQRKNTSLMLLALIALDPVMVLTSGANLYAYQYLHEAGHAWLAWGFYYGVLGWYTLAASVAAIRLLQVQRSRYLAVAAATIVTLLLPWIYLDRDDRLWLPNYVPEEQAGDYMKEYYALTSEDAFYAQSALLEKALSTLEPGKAGQVELFFVGMAGYASQDVFMKEAGSVADLFERRFGTAGHSLKLINNAKSVAETPVASATALRASLKKISSLMNPDEDILFLFMTSHGSRDHVFSLRFGPMKFNDINPGVLRTLLDESGIKRRVIVISACYSGGFVDALKDDNSLIITASAPDRNSFGCNNENDFTYFGQAYFDEALRKDTYSFTEAFERARLRIAEREKAEKLDPPSDPRMAVGKDIAPVLDAFAREREAAMKKDALSSAR